MAKEKYIGTKFLIILSMIMLGVIGAIALANLSKFSESLNLLLSLLGEGYKITGLYSSAYIFGIILYMMLFASIIALLVSLFIPKKFKILDSIILVLFCSFLFFSLVLMLIYNLVGNSLLSEILLDLTAGSTVGKDVDITISQQIAYIQTTLKPILSVINEMFLYAIPICILGIIIQFNSLQNYKEVNYENKVNNRIAANDTPENMAQKILSNKINEANEKLKTRELEIEYEAVMKKIKEIENSK